MLQVVCLLYWFSLDVQRRDVYKRQVEERKALNAAFAHDLRTPLTVLKGYNEMLQASDNSRCV